MSDYFTVTGDPVAQSRGASAVIRSVISAISAGFDKLPTLAQVWGGSANYTAAGGSTNAWTATVASTYLTSLAQGMQVRINFPAANTTTTPTLNLNALGAKIITRTDATALSVGDIGADATVSLTYDASGSGTWRLSGSTADASAAAASAAAAASSASAASTSAATAAAYAAALSGTSTSAVLIGTGSKSFTSQANKAWVVGQFLIAASAGTPTNYMIGQVTAYNSGSGALTLNVTTTSGAATPSDWNIGITGATGATGADGMSINSTQRGTIAIAGGASSNTATITAVDTAKTQLRFLGCTNNSGVGSDPGADAARIVLTNSTTITATRDGSTTPTVVVSWELTEFT